MEKKKGRRAGTVLLIVLLAAVCISGVELAVCSIADPALFERIVTPVRGFFERTGAAIETGYQAIAENVSGTVAEVRGKIEARREARAQAELARKAAEAEALAAQEGGDPAVEKEYVPAAPEITQLVSQRGREMLLGGNVPLVYYNQADAAWASKSYGTDPIAIYGCGPTVMAMLVSSLTDTQMNPEEMAAWAAENGYAAPQSGSYHSIVEGTAEHFGLDCVSLAGLGPDEVEQELIVSGGIVVALVGPGHFTKGGHFILIHGAALTGEVLVADPNSRERSLTAWDLELILSELYPATDSGAPLWLITRGNIFGGDLAPEDAAAEE